VEIIDKPFSGIIRDIEVDNLRYSNLSGARLTL